MLKTIQDFIDKEINPVLANHGGGCHIVDYEDGVVRIKFEGGCSGCPSRQFTLLNAVTPALKEKFPDDIKDVVLD